MSIDSIFDICASGMALERLRLDVVAHNLANQNTVADANGNLFQPLSVEARASDFSSLIETRLVPQNLPPTLTYEPNHPNANTDGFVAHPGINNIDEMVTLLSAQRSYEADIKVFNTAKALTQYALTLGEKP